MSTVNNKLTNLADEIRVLSGTTEPLGLGEMATNVGAANTQVAEIEGLIEELNAALDGKSIPGEGTTEIAKENATVTFNWTAASSYHRPTVLYPYWLNETLYTNFYEATSDSGSSTLLIAKGHYAVIVLYDIGYAKANPKIQSGCSGDITKLSAYGYDGPLTNGSFIVNGDGSINATCGGTASGGSN